MSEFEDRLEAILGNPDAMAQIMSLAQNLGGTSQSETPTPPPADLPPGLPSDPGTLFGMLGDLDPQMIQEGMKLFSQLSAANDERTALLCSLKPFLKEERYAKMDRAIQIARLSRVIRTALRLFQGRGESHV